MLLGNGANFTEFQTRLRDSPDHKLNKVVKTIVARESSGFGRKGSSPFIPTNGQMV